MFTDLALSPATYSPTLLRTEPAYLASWIRYRFVKWLLDAPLVKTSFTCLDEKCRAVIGGSQRSPIRLDVGSGFMEPECAFSGAGLRVGLPIPVSLQDGLPNIRDSRTAWIVPRSNATGVDHIPDQAAAGEAMGQEALGVTKSCLLIDLRHLIEAKVARQSQGVARGAILFGVEPELRANLDRLGVYSRRLAAAASDPLTRSAVYKAGFTRTGWVPVDRHVGIDMRAIHEEVQHMFGAYDFASILYLDAIDGAGTHDEISVYFGDVTNAQSDGRGSVPLDLPDIVNKLMGESPSDMKQTLIDTVAEKVSGGNEYVQKAVSFGLSHAGESGSALKQDLLSEAGSTFMGDHPGLKYPAVAALGAAAACGKGVFQGAAVDLLKGEGSDLTRTVLNSACERFDVPVPSGVTDFLVNHAESLASTAGRQQTVMDALVSSVGSTELAHAAVGTLLEKVAGPVTTIAVKTLSAPVLSNLVQSGPVIASGATDAAVTHVAGNDVHVDTGQPNGKSSMSFSKFASTFSTIVTPGIL